MKKIIVLFCLLTVCLSLLAPVQASESEAPVTAGTLAGGFSWEAADGVLTITGSGAMPDFEDYLSVSWGHLGDSIHELRIGEGITHLADYTGISHAATGIPFSRITLPTTLTSIGDLALSDNPSLTELTLPDGLTAIGDYAFYGCTGLTEIAIPDNAISIGRMAFSATNISTFHIGKNAVFVGADAFPGSSAVYYAGSDSQWRSIVENYYRPSILYTIEGGACGENLTWTLDYTGTLTVSGTGAMDNYTSNTMPWYSQRSKIKSVVIEEGVTSLGSYAFYNHSNLTSVSVSASVETIGESTFTLCEKLRSITLSSGLITIGNSAFTSCTALTSIDIPSTVTSIENYAFSGSGLTKIVIPEGISKIGYATFRGCTSLAEVVLPSTVTSIGNEAFHNCTALKKVNIPNGVTSIGVSAFYFCSSLTEIAIPTGVTSIGAEAFMGCSALKTVTGGESVASIGAYTFAGCTSLEVFPFSPELTTVGAYAFQNCAALSVSLSGEKLTSIGNYAFSGCSKLQAVTFPATLTTIGNNAFENCTGLQTVTVPATVTSLSTSVFYGCTGLTSAVLAEGITEIPGGTFSGCSGLKAVSIPSTVTALGSSVFSGCSSLTAAVIPQGVVSIPKYAFYKCTYLESVSLPASLLNIQDYAFSSCGSLNHVVIPGKVTYIGDQAFYRCISLTDVTIPVSVKNIYEKAFYWCTHLRTKGTVTYTGTKAQWNNISIYSGNEDLTDASIRYTGVTQQGTCGSTLNWTLNDSGELIISGTGDMTVFSSASAAPWYSYRSSVTSVTVKDGVTSVSPYAFDGYYNLQSLSLADSITSIGRDAFYGCSNLTTVTLPRSLTSISANTFYGCTALNELFFYSGVRSIANSAFYNCTALGDVVFVGTEAQWSAMTVGSNNSALTAAVRNYAASLDDVVRLELYQVYNGTATLSVKSDIAIKSQTVTVYPVADAGYIFSHLEVDGTPVSGTSFTVTGNHRIGVRMTEYRDAYQKASGSNWVLYGDGELYINGTGGAGSDTWSEYADEITTVTIAEGITYVGSYAFSDCTNLTGVRLPSTVTSIYNNAFESCTALQEIVIPSSVTEILADAFKFCTVLNDVIYLGTAEQKSSMNINSRNTELIAAVWHYAPSREDVYGLTLTPAANGTAAFSHNSNLGAKGSTVSVNTLPDAGYVLSGINVDGVFRSGSTFTVTGNHTVTPVFVSYRSGDVTASGTCGDHVRWTLYSDGELLLTGSGSVADYYFSSFTSSPGKEYREMIRRVTVTEGISAIGQYAFCECTALEAVILPGSLASIGSSAFADCPMLHYAVYLGTEQQWSEITVGYDNTALTQATRHTASSMEDVVTLTLLQPTGGTVSLAPCSFMGVKGYSFMVTPTPDPGYLFGSILVDGRPIDGNSFVIFGDHTVSAAFTPYKNSAVTASGTCGDAMKWVLFDDGELLIEGSGEMTDYPTAADVPWQAYRADITDITFLGDVLSIGNYAFAYCSGLTDIALPDTLTSIGDYAFYDCTALVEIDLPNTLTNIGSSAFRDCNTLAEIILPQSLASIGSSAFYSCDALTSITLPTGITTVSDELFGGCGQLTDIAFAGAVTSIGNQAFYGCSALTEIVLPDTLTTIGEYAFAYCSGLTEIDLPSGITTVSWGAFKECTNLTEVTLPPLLGEVSDYLFEGCSRLTEVVLPSGISSVGFRAFYSCSALKTVFYMNTAENWKSVAVRDENRPLTLASIYFIQSMDDILHLTVTQPANGTLTVDPLVCAKGTTVRVTAHPDPGYKLGAVLLDGVKLEQDTFTAADNHNISAQFTFYKSVTASGNCGDDAYWVLHSDGELRIYGSGSIQQYEAGRAPWYPYRWLATTLTIEEGITSVSSWAFSDCTALTGISLPASLTSIGAEAFINCDGLTAVEIPDTVTFLSSSAFSGCDSLKRAVIGNGVTAVNWGLFYNCAALEEVVLGDGITSIGNAAFYQCSALRSVTFGSGLRTIADKAFFRCESLQDLALPEGLISIDSDAFEYCKSLTEITIPDSVTTIGDRAFHNCASLQELTIGSGVTSIGDRAFNYGYSLEHSLHTATFKGDAPQSFGVGVFPISDAGKFVICYQEGASGWTTPTWNGYYTVCNSESELPYDTLDENNRNAQGIFFTLNETAKTAVVGDASDTSNNSGYYGSQSGQVVIPDTVTKNGVTYQVVGIGRNAFSGNGLLVSASIGANISSIQPSSFDACPNLTAFSVDAGNTRYTAEDGILYSAAKTTLYRYPVGKPGESFTVGSSVKEISALAFSGCSNLRTLVIPTTVETIVAGALTDCSNLESITLPFVGTSSNSHFSSLFSKNGLHEPETLKTVVILGGSLSGNCFSYCENIRSITLPASVTSIPDYTFVGCSALHALQFAGVPAAAEGELVFPAQITSVGLHAFSGCIQFTKVSIPAEMRTITFGAFQGCSGITAFTANENNPNYCADSEGVLYSKDKSDLIAYPAGSGQPYYSIPATVTAVSSSAFHSCSALVNLYIPSTVTDLQQDNFASCPALTLCVYRGSTAARYAQDNALSVLYMDDYPLQSITAEKPEQPLILAIDQDASPTLHIVGDYGAFRLPIADYELIYHPGLSGVQTAAVSCQGMTDEIEVLVYNDRTEVLISFGQVTPPQGSISYGAVYNSNGKMLCIRPGIHLDGHMYLIVPKADATSRDEARMFLLDSSMLPLTAAIPAL